MTTTTAPIDLDKIKAKMAKLLAMQSSNNPNEAANAAAFLDKICREYGISPSTVTAYEDSPEDGTILHEFLLDGARLSKGDIYLLQAVVSYYDGDIISTFRERGGRGHRYDVFASEGNMIKIKIYYEYLKNQMEVAAQAEKFMYSMRGGSTQGYIYNFKKGYAAAVYKRLQDMKVNQHIVGIQTPTASIPGLVIAKRSELDKKQASKALFDFYPKARVTNAQIVKPSGRGYGEGVQAGRSASLSQQVSGSSRKQLPGY